jgi:hypothetical protein
MLDAHPPPPRPSFFAPEDAAWLAGFGAEAGESRIRLNSAVALHGDAADLPTQEIDALRAAYADYAANVRAYLYALTS